MIETRINREYVRTDCWSVVAKTSREEDYGSWIDVRVPNIAAGGLLFLTGLQYETGESLWFDLQIDPLTPGVSGMILMKVKGEIKGDRGVREGQRAYSVEFTEISKSDRIRLDELVRITNLKYKLDSECDFFDR